jgi:uncharacterized LabA/DUF88 family protein
VRHLLIFLILHQGVRFLSLIEFILGADDSLFISRMVSVIYRDYVNGVEATAYDRDLYNRLRNQGIDVIEDISGAEFRRKKAFNLDPVIVKDIRAAAGDGDVGTIVFVSGDGGFASVLAEARQMHKEVIVVSGKNHLSPRLSAVANRTFTIENLAKKMGYEFPFNRWRTNPVVLEFFLLATPQQGR